jgi:hypothetical protein
VAPKVFGGLEVSRYRLLGNARRLVRAFVLHVLPRKKTYASDGEDYILLELLASYDLGQAVYVDVGANDPVFMSNTYLFYRHGITVSVLIQTLRWRHYMTWLEVEMYLLLQHVQMNFRSSG